MGAEEEERSWLAERPGRARVLRVVVKQPGRFHRSYLSYWSYRTDGTNRTDRTDRTIGRIGLIGPMATVTRVRLPAWKTDRP